MNSIFEDAVRVRRQCNSSITHKTDRIIFNSFIIQIEATRTWEKMRAKLDKTDAELLLYVINHGFWGVLDDIDPICSSSCGTCVYERA